MDRFPYGVRRIKYCWWDEINPIKWTAGYIEYQYQVPLIKEEAS
jgi:hypothetical protein